MTERQAILRDINNALADAGGNGRNASGRLILVSRDSGEQKGGALRAPLKGGKKRPEAAPEFWHSTLPLAQVAYCLP